MIDKYFIFISKRKSKLLLVNKRIKTNVIRDDKKINKENHLSFLFVSFAAQNDQLKSVLGVAESFSSRPNVMIYDFLNPGEIICEYYILIVDRLISSFT